MLLIIDQWINLKAARWPALCLLLPVRRSTGVFRPCGMPSGTGYPWGSINSVRTSVWCPCCSQTHDMQAQLKASACGSRSPALQVIDPLATTLPCPAYSDSTKLPPTPSHSAPSLPYNVSMYLWCITSSGLHFYLPTGAGASCVSWLHPQSFKHLNC
jgi:hypothetical protein